MKNSHNSAFSLIELSIVILIIGILIAGVIQGSKIYTFSKLQVARSLTTSSSVAGIKDLMLWYETSLETSFKSTEAIDSTAISTWYDNNPQAIAKNNATQVTASFRPKFYENVANGIPVIRYDGSNDTMSFDGKFLANSNYTIFVVEQRRAATSCFFTYGTDTITDNGILHVGYRADVSPNARLTQAHYNNDLNYLTPLLLYSEPIVRMHSFWFSKTTGKKYWTNGGNVTEASNSQTTALISYNGAIFGNSGCNIDFAEFIIFARDLTTEERQSVEDYLSKKYAITISW